MSIINLTAYVARGNIDLLAIRSNGQKIPDNTVIRAKLVIVDGELNYCLDTDEATDPISFIDDNTTIRLQLGFASFAQALLGKTLPAKLILYDTATPQGLAWWGNEYQVTFEAWDDCA